MKKTPNEIKLLPIEQFYSQEGSEVWWNYRFNGGEWKKELTAFPRLPYVVIKPDND